MKQSQTALVPIVLAALVSTLLFAVMILGKELPILADDYYTFRLALSDSHLLPTGIYTFARMPVSTFNFWLGMKLGIWQNHPTLSFIFFFGLHTIAFSILLFRLVRLYFPAPSPALSKDRATFELLLFASIAALFALNPNNYEIHLWHTLSTHSIGALLLAVSFPFPQDRTSPWRVMGSVIGCSLGLLTYDTFPMLLLGLLCFVFFHYWYGKKQSPSHRKLDSTFKKAIIRYGSFTAMTLLLTVGTKVLIGKWTGFLQVVPVEHSWPALLDHAKNLLKTMGLLHFYKEYWVLSAALWGAVIGLFTLLKRDRSVNFQLMIAVFCLPFLCASPLILNTYSAQRAFYGPQIVLGLSLGILFYTGLRSNKNKLGYICFGIFILAYLIQWSQIIKLKQQNSMVLAQQESLYREEMDRCSSPCTIITQDPARNLNRDYILPQFVWNDYFEGLRLKYHPEKVIRFEVR